MGRFSIVLLVGLVGLALQPASAQPLIERDVVLNPFWETPTVAEGERRFVHSYGGWAGLATYAGLRDTDHQWNHQIGGFLELGRWGDTASLLITTQIEFIADPNNDINFNPRAIFWEEGLLYTRRMGAGFWQLGYYHRCKHDIDNLSLGEERTLIYGSFKHRLLWPTTLPGAEDGYLAWTTDVYSIRQDTRTPPNDQLPNVNQKLLSTGLQAHTRRATGEQSGLFATVYGNATLYSETTGFFDRFGSVKNVRAQGGVSAGLSVRGGAALRLAVTYEYLADTGIPVEPQDGHLLRIGLTALSLNGLR